MSIFFKFKEYFKSVRKQFFKFFVVGVSSVVLDLALLIFLKEKVGCSPVSAVALNQIVVIIYNFILNKYWSFGSKQMLTKQFVRYLFLVLINYCLSIVSMYIFNTLIGINYQIVRLLTVGVLFVFNFIFYKYWVYKED